LVYVKMVEGRPTAAPTPAPTVVPTPPPTISLIPTPAPTMAPSVSPLPSPQPTVTPRPSSLPTISLKYPYSCSALSSEGITESGTYTIWPTGPTGSNYTVYCDMTTDGGGWMLTWAYNHIGGQTVPLVPGTIPTDPKMGYSHVDVDSMYSATSEISEVRFYCTSSSHDRVIHFKQSNSFIKDAALDGDTTGNAASYWNTGYTFLVNHTGYLPGTADTGYASASSGFGYLPFFQFGSRHWIIYSFQSRFECDDYSFAASDTQHLVYVKMVEGRPTAAPTSSPSPPPTALPSFQPTTLPTPSPSPLPTTAPTTSPTLLPTPSPTLTPIPSPTFLPTLFPSPLPTLVPSLQPTFLPSLVPSSIPTPLPSPRPTTVLRSRVRLMHTCVNFYSKMLP
jgi:hypothetical protein